MTYMRHRGQPTRSIALVSSASQDTHELSTETCDELEDSDDRSEEDTEVAALGGDRFSLTSNLGLLALFLISLHQSQFLTV